MLSDVNTEESDAIGEQLDNEIESLEEQIASLKAQRSFQVSSILSSRASKATLDRLRIPKANPFQTTLPQDANPLIAASLAQLSHNQENLYRLCAGITSFRIRDPDPNAVDDGNVLGLRFDVSTAGKFIHPYYVMLNKPWAELQLLRVHRHTLPPYIPIAAIAEKHLPGKKGSIPMGVKGAAGSKKQDLRRFAREIRHHIVSHHNRVSITKSLRNEFRLGQKALGKGKEKEKVIEDISAVDAENKEIRIDWVDGRVGRISVDDKGKVMKCVIMGEAGRDTENEVRVMREDMAGIGERLREGIY